MNHIRIIYALIGITVALAITLFYICWNKPFYKIEGFNEEAIENLASVLNTGKMIVNELEVKKDAKIANWTIKTSRIGIPDKDVELHMTKTPWLRLIKYGAPGEDKSITPNGGIACNKIWAEGKIVGKNIEVKGDMEVKGNIDTKGVMEAKNVNADDINAKRITAEFKLKGKRGYIGEWTMKKNLLESTNSGGGYRLDIDGKWRRG